MIKYGNYRIEPNDYGGYILKETKKSKAGEEYMVVICYPSTLKSALLKIRELEFAKNVNFRDMELNEAIAELERIQDKLVLKE